MEPALAAAHFWSDTVPEGPGGLGGSWILEGVRTDRRALVDHWSPQEVGPDAAFRRAANHIWISRTPRQTRATEGAI